MTRHSKSSLDQREELLEPIAVLAFQISHTSAARLLPEVSLMAAVLGDALRCIHKNLSIESGRNRREFVAACSWIFDHDETWPFAFTNVCAMLGLNAQAVRRNVGRLLSSPEFA